jgi:hypothetical protein
MMNSMQGEILTSEICVSVKHSGESCKWQKRRLADQLRELESQSIQVTLLILLQSYDIISRERTDDVMYDIIKY